MITRRMITTLPLDSEGNTKPARCAYCHQRKAFYTVVGTHHFWDSGKTCCDDCWPSVQSANNKLILEKRHLTEDEIIAKIMEKSGRVLVTS